MKRFGRASAACALLIGLSCGCANDDDAENAANNPPGDFPADPFSGTAQAQPDAAATDLSEVVDRVLPSVVSVATERVSRAAGPGSPFSDPMFRRFFGLPEGMPEERIERGLGSGVYIGEGVVVTNFHVIENAESIAVTGTGDVVMQAEVVGADPPSDLAVLRITSEIQNLEPAVFGDSSEIELGDVVLAVGNPFGVGTTVTMGIISAKGRANVGIADYEDFIQTDAAINPGNSGGALVNMRGEVIGINTAILSQTGGFLGIGFAVPSDMVQPIARALVEEGRVVRGWLGVAIQELTPELAEALELDATQGVLISGVEPEGPAAAAGLEPGDVIVAVDGQAVRSAGRLRNLIAEAGAGQRVALTLVRDGTQRQVEVELGELPAQRPAARAEALTQPEAGPAGMSLEALSPATRQRFRIPPEVDSGVVVSSVDPTSPAGRAGLQPGDVIVQLDRRPVPGPNAFRELWAASEGDALLLVRRGDQSLFTVLERP